MTPGFSISLLSLAIWLVLAFGRSGFWRIRQLPQSSDPKHWPDVVAVVPARDEAEVIVASLGSLITQGYQGHFHIILVDDHSTDGTADLARCCAEQLGASEQLTVLHARNLPSGWAGKVWAQSEGIAASELQFPDARYVWLTDADIGHAPGVLQQLVACAEAEQRDLTSLMVRLRCASLAERALIPAFVFFFAMLYPFARVNDPRDRTAAAAGGCMLVRRTALTRIGGIASIKDALIDDCALGAQIKRGGSIRLDLAQHSESLRHYDNWRSIWDMIARSAYTQLRYSPWLLLGTLVGMCLTYVAPPVLAIAGAFAGVSAGLAAALAWLLMSAIYGPMLRYYRRSLWWAPLLPLIALFYLGATWASAWRFWRGQGGQWKGRVQAPAQR